MKILRSILFALVGIVCLGTGIQMYNSDVGRMASYQEYGGDAYTGIQNAEVQTGGLVRIQSDILAKGLGYIMIYGGLTLIICAIPVNKKKNENEKVN